MEEKRWASRNKDGSYNLHMMSETKPKIDTCGKFTKGVLVALDEELFHELVESRIKKGDCKEIETINFNLELRLKGEAKKKPNPQAPIVADILANAEPPIR